MAWAFQKGEQSKPKETEQPPSLLSRLPRNQAIPYADSLPRWAVEGNSVKTDLLWDFGISYVFGMTISELQEQLDRRDKQIEELATRIRQLERENQELKKLLVEKAQSKECKPPKEARNFSVSRYEQKRRTKRRRKNSTGRRPKDAKRDFATETIDLYWHATRGFSVHFRPCCTSAVLVEGKECSRKFWGNDLTGSA